MYLAIRLFVFCYDPPPPPTRGRRHEDTNAFHRDFLARENFRPESRYRREPNRTFKTLIYGRRENFRQKCPRSSTRPAYHRSMLVLRARAFRHCCVTIIAFLYADPGYRSILWMVDDVEPVYFLQSAKILVLQFTEFMEFKKQATCCYSSYVISCILLTAIPFFIIINTAAIFEILCYLCIQS